MTNEELADELIARLNKALENPDVRADIGKLIATRIPCSEATKNHETIQASTGLGFLGLLNGLVGIRQDGWGLVAAVLDDGMELVRFQRTAVTPVVKS